MIIQIRKAIYTIIDISISEGNSSLNEINNGQNDDININKINRSDIEIEKNLIDLSNELFLFYYITKQFDKNKLIQLPRVLFFVCLYDDEFRNIYEIEEEKENIKIRIKENIIEEKTKRSETNGMNNTDINSNNIEIMIQKKKDLKEKVKERVKENMKEKNRKKI